MKNHIYAYININNFYRLRIYYNYSVILNYLKFISMYCYYHLLVILVMGLVFNHLLHLFLHLLFLHHPRSPSHQIQQRSLFLAFFKLVRLMVFRQWWLLGQESVSWLCFLRNLLAFQTFNTFFLRIHKVFLMNLLI